MRATPFTLLFFYVILFISKHTKDAAPEGGAARQSSPLGRRCRCSSCTSGFDAGVSCIFERVTTHLIQRGAQMTTQSVDKLTHKRQKQENVPKRSHYLRISACFRYG